MNKPSVTTYPIHELISNRWSPRAFTDRPVDTEMVGSLFEAARWAPSSFNGQPWRFLVASRHDDPAGFAKLAACLVEGNAWAKESGVLLLAVARMTFERNDKPNRHAFHDVGLALENLMLQAQSMGLYSHAMAGFDGQKARETLGIPDGFEPITMCAVGHPGKPEALDEDLRESERAPRSRKPLAETVFGAAWDKPLDL